MLKFLCQQHDHFEAYAFQDKQCLFSLNVLDMEGLHGIDLYISFAIGVWAGVVCVDPVWHFLYASYTDFQGRVSKEKWCYYSYLLLWEVVFQTLNFFQGWNDNISWHLFLAKEHYFVFVVLIFVTTLCGNTVLSTLPSRSWKERLLMSMLLRKMSVMYLLRECMLTPDFTGCTDIVER